ncbi:MAG: hypothetical protein K0R73_1012 [Candidatus Midichloriaceae bacterium]|jgi:hypothetical protein|nr:hypothetical protein [Candidatus Midichloriaceae bacterium]
MKSIEIQGLPDGFKTSSKYQDFQQKLIDLKNFASIANTSEKIEEYFNDLSFTSGSFTSCIVPAINENCISREEGGEILNKVLIFLNTLQGHCDERNRGHSEPASNDAATGKDKDKSASSGASDDGELALALQNKELNKLGSIKEIRTQNSIKHKGSVQERDALNKYDGTEIKDLPAGFTAYSNYEGFQKKLRDFEKFASENKSDNKKIEEHFYEPKSVRILGSRLRKAAFLKKTV